MPATRSRPATPTRLRAWWTAGVGVLVLILLGVLVVRLTLGDASAVEAEEQPAPTEEEAVAGAEDPTQASGDPPAAEAALPSVPPEQLEIHGRWRGERFWARLGPLLGQGYGGRPLRIVYSAPEREALGGTMLADYPWLVVDDHLRIRFWYERKTVSQLEYDHLAAEPHYRRQRESERVVGDEVFPQVDEDRVASATMVWDQRLGPVLLALAWREGSRATVPMLDLMAAEPGAVQTLSWDDDEVRLGDQRFVVEADADGRLARLLTDDGTVLLEVSEHREPVPPAAAAEQERAFLEHVRSGE